MSEENDTGQNQEQSEEKGPASPTESNVGPDYEATQEEGSEKQEHDSRVEDDEVLDAIKSQATETKHVENEPEASGEKEGTERLAIETNENEVLDAIKSQATETKHGENEPEVSGEKEGIERPAIETSEDEVLDAIKSQATETRHRENEPEGSGASVKESSEVPTIEADEDEILDEIKPKTTEIKQVDPEQYKKDFNRNQVEAVLFVSGQAVSAEEISVKLTIPRKQVETLLEKLAMEYLERSTALEIAKIADKYILQLKPEFTSHVKSFASGGLIREAVMRTLTIIAAKQPILQSDLSKIRSSAGEHLKELLDMGLIKKTPKGRSSELITTDKFADMFGFSRDVAKMKEQIKIYLTAVTKDEE